MRRGHTAQQHVHPQDTVAYFMPFNASYNPYQSAL